MSFNKKEVFGLIPARGNSKGIDNKNIFKINDKLLIDFTIESAIGSKNIDQVYVSSDSEQILDHALSKGIKAISRPKSLAKDDSSANDVVYHFYDFLITNQVVKKKEDFYLIYLQPTSPLRTSEIINQSFKLLSKTNKSSLISLTKNEYTPYKSFLINRAGLTESLFEESITNANRQNLNTTYRANGAIYTFLMSKFNLNKGFPSNNSVPFIMEQEDSLDIDSYKDIDTLKLILNEKAKN